MLKVPLWGVLRLRGFLGVRDALVRWNPLKGPPMSLRTPLYLSLLLALLLAPVWTGPAAADVLTTSDGLVLEGRVERLANGWYRVTTENGAVEFAPASVASTRLGVNPRAEFLKQKAAADPKDVVAQFKLALEATEAGLADLAREAYGRVLTLEPDQRAARRALGFERLDEKWVTADEACRNKGLVLYRGKWMLPAEVEAASGATAVISKLKVPADVERTRKLIRTLATGEAPMQHAARVALAQADDRLLLEAGLAMLFEKEAGVRIAAVRILGALGDESALRPLIFSGARDRDASVRREAVLAAASFGHDDTAIPFTRALASENNRLAANAAEALALLGDERTADYVVKRLRSHGSSTRNMVAFLSQVSYVRDYDVEIAQASNIANPDVATISAGVVLDVKVLDAAFTKTWIEPLLVKAFNEIVGQDLRNAREVEAWYAENGRNLRRFPPKPGARAPRRVKGRVIGAPMDRE